MSHSPGQHGASKNTSRSWPSDRIHVIRWEVDLHSFTKMTGNFQPRTKRTKSRDGKTCHTSKDLFLEMSWKKVSRLKTHFGHFLLLFSNNAAWHPGKTCADPQSKIGRIPLLLLVLTQYQYPKSCIATCIAKFIAIHVFHVFWKDTPKCNKRKSANTAVLIHIQQDRIVTINVHLYSLIILSYSNIVQHGYKIHIPENRHFDIA